MNKGQLEFIEKIRKAEIEQSERWIDYWQEYSNFYTWEFWVVLAMFLIPLVILIIFIDRKNIFYLGFYGYSVHIFFSIADAMGASKGLWVYPYKLLPGIPSNISLDASFVPVSFILFYQYLLKKGKNYYMWILLLCLGFAFFLKPILLGIGLFRFGGNENFLILFWIYLAIALISKWITDVFTFLSKTKKWSINKNN